MSYRDNFEIKYWGTDYYSNLDPQKPKRSLRKKLFIVLGFIVVLAVLPAMVFGITNLRSHQSKKISSAAEIQPNPTPTPSKKPIELKTPEITGETVLNNDSYWIISKRHCGTGKYYLSIRDQNAGKPLYKGDFVKAICNL